MASADVDFIVAGGGSAGAVIASRLSEDPTCRVALIEAGGHPPEHEQMPLAAATLQLDPETDWMYQGDPRSCWPAASSLPRRTRSGFRKAITTARTGSTPAASLPHPPSMTRPCGAPRGSATPTTSSRWSRPCAWSSSWPEGSAGTWWAPPELSRKHGYEAGAGLRIVDASVMPDFISANTNAACIMIGEKAAGLEKGDRFAWLSKNSIDHALMFFAASKVGVVPVPLNYRLAPREWLYIANDAESRILFVQREFIDGIESVRAELKVETFVALDEDCGEWTGFEGWLSTEETNPRANVGASDQLYQMYTSGTTGLPKGAMLSQFAIANSVAMLLALRNAPMNPRYLIVAPLYHAAAAVTMMACAAQGGTAVIHADFIPAATVKSLSEDGITNATLVPAMIQACLVGVPEVGERPYDALQTISYGVSPIATETLRSAMTTFKCDFMQACGMTETTVMAAALGPAEHKRALAGEVHLLKSAMRRGWTKKASSTSRIASNT